jgi:hypothetical protein
VDRAQGETFHAYLGFTCFICFLSLFLLVYIRMLVFVAYLHGNSMQALCLGVMLITSIMVKVYRWKLLGHFHISSNFFEEIDHQSYTYIIHEKLLAITRS